MKIAVFSDIHGSVSGTEKILEICGIEKPDKAVICGDLFGGWFDSAKQIAEIIAKVDFPLYLIRGNNDRPHDEAFLSCGMDDYAVMYHFGKTLFFTHGDRYDKYRPPALPVDALVYGHTHMGLLQKYNGMYIANVGSLTYPRDGQSCYLIIDEVGFTLKCLDGSKINVLPW